LKPKNVASSEIFFFTFTVKKPKNISWFIPQKRFSACLLDPIFILSVELFYKQTKNLKCLPLDFMTFTASTEHMGYKINIFIFQSSATKCALMLS
jgi:hypothetical protein